MFTLKVSRADLPDFRVERRIKGLDEGRFSYSGFAADKTKVIFTKISQFVDSFAGLG